MKRQRKLYRLYGIIGSEYIKNGMSIIEAAEEAIKGGVTIIQLREKNKSEEEIIQIALKVREVCRRYNVPFIINDSAKLACKCGADGVHLGQCDDDPLYARRILGEDAIIGITAHSLFEAQNALISGADYLGCGSVFESQTKGYSIRLEMDVLREICSKIDIPVIAIGGINVENLTKLRGTGVSGVAVISSIFSQKDIKSSAILMKGLAESI